MYEIALWTGKIAQLSRWIEKGSMRSFSLSLKKEVLVLKLSRFHFRNVKEKRRKMLCLENTA